MCNARKAANASGVEPACDNQRRMFHSMRYTQHVIHKLPLSMLNGQLVAPQLGPRLEKIQI